MWASGNSPKHEKQSNKLGHEVCFINHYQHGGSNFIFPFNDWDLALWWWCQPLNPIHRFKSPDSSNQKYLAGKLLTSAALLCFEPDTNEMLYDGIISYDMECISTSKNFCNTYHMLQSSEIVQEFYWLPTYIESSFTCKMNIHGQMNYGSHLLFLKQHYVWTLWTNTKTVGKSIISIYKINLSTDLLSFLLAYLVLNKSQERNNIWIRTNKERPKIMLHAFNKLLLLFSVLQRFLRPFIVSSFIF